MWWLNLTRHNQIFLNRNVPDCLAEVLQDGGLTGTDFETRLSGVYPARDYVCQYGESHFNFVSRWMEREGIYYFFEQTPSGEKMILTDSAVSHTSMPQGRTLTYAPPSGLDHGAREEVIHSFICRQYLLPQEILLKDYNYQTPSLQLTGRAEVSGAGRGQVYIYGEHFLTPEEGRDLAGIRAESYLCREKEFYGQSAVPFLRPGYTFELQDHYRMTLTRNT